LRAYIYDGASFTNTAHIDDGGTWDFAGALAVGPDGTVFLAHADEGLIAYTYSSYTVIANELSKIPIKYKLLQNYPNPFNPSTIIKYFLPKPEAVKIEVYNTLGQKIQTLLNISMPAGYHEVEFNAQNLPSGVYLYRIKAGEFLNVNKMILLK